MNFNDFFKIPFFFRIYSHFHTQKQKRYVCENFKKNTKNSEEDHIYKAVTKIV